MKYDKTYKDILKRNQKINFNKEKFLKEYNKISLNMKKDNRPILKLEEVLLLQLENKLSVFKLRLFSIHYKIDENIIELFKDKWNWYYLIKYQKLSIPFIKKHFKYCKQYLHLICLFQHIDNDFVEQYHSYFNYICYINCYLYQNLLKYTLDKYKNEISQAFAQLETEYNDRFVL